VISPTTKNENNNKTINKYFFKQPKTQTTTTENTIKTNKKSYSRHSLAVVVGEL